MTTDLSEDVVLQISPQILTSSLTSETNTQTSILEYVNSQPIHESAAGATCGSPSVAGRGGACSGSAELGRRLLLAARHGQTSLVLDLMAKGAPFTTDWLGTSPLHLAASHAHVDTCAVLLRAGVSRDSRTKVERTPLHLAAHAGHAAVVALLLQNGALVDCTDMLRMTPLHWAAERGHAAAAAELLRHGADPLLESKFHKTPRSLAAQRRDAAVLRLIDEALREREAARSVDALREATEEMMEIPAAEQQRALESIERLQETVKQPNKQQSVHTEPIKIELERPPEAGGGSSLAAALLRKHGITMLPHDETSTVLNAIQSGRTVVLSDAGKLMLKESSDPPAPAPTSAPAPPPPSKGVILTAAPVKSPPKAGVKIFTLNNKLLAMPKENKLPVKRVINPQDMQIKFTNLPLDTKLVPAGKVTKARGRARLTAPLAAAAAPHAPAVKFIMQKANFNKMVINDADNGMEVTSTNTTMMPTTELTKVLHASTVAPSVTAAPAAGAGAAEGVGGGSAVGGVLCVPAEFLSSNSTQYLRAQLLSAHHTIQELRRELSALQQRHATGL